MTQIVIDLPTELGERLEKAAQQHGLDLSEYVRPILEEVASRMTAPVEDAPDGTDSSALPRPEPEDSGSAVLAMVQEIWGPIPDDEIAALPTDLSENLDRYLYGTSRGK